MALQLILQLTLGDSRAPHYAAMGWWTANTHEAPNPISPSPSPMLL